MRGAPLLRTTKIKKGLKEREKESERTELGEIQSDKEVMMLLSRRVFILFTYHTRRRNAPCRL